MAFVELPKWVEFTGPGALLKLFNDAHTTGQEAGGVYTASVDSGDGAMGSAVLATSVAITRSTGAMDWAEAVHGEQINMDANGDVSVAPIETPQEVVMKAIGGASGMVLSGTGLAKAQIKPESSAGPCFISGTLVATPDGYVEIDSLEAGDIVLAYNFDSGNLIEREVLETLSNFTYYWIDVVVAGETIVATRFHRFWVESENDWLYAVGLKPGMTVRLADGELAEVESVSLRELDNPERTFNLEVDSDHNYFVGINSILVHNGDENGNSKRSEKPQHRYVIKDTQVTNPAGGSDAVKTGVSGTELNKNGTSGRANKQVNQFNRQEGANRFTAEVVEKNVTGSDGQSAREKILDSEKQAATDLKKKGNTMRKHVRPKPGC